MENFEVLLDERVKEVDEIIMRYLPPEEGFQKTVIKAMNYSVLAGGKRLRPLMMQETYRLFGGNAEVIEPFMAAIEMIHTYSLIHDDLPCMDNDRLRRGRATTWVEYGEDMAVLAGDGLLGYAFETALKAFKMTDDTARAGSALSILANRSGIYGMLGGQTADVELTGRSLNEEQIDFIYHLKTGALIEASMMIGAELAGASQSGIDTAGRAASLVGMAFQIRDDILDLTADEGSFGKPVLSDEKNNKTTYVSLNGLEKSKEEVVRLSEEACGLLDLLPGDHEFLEQLFMMLTTRDK